MNINVPVEEISPHSFGLLLTRQCPAQCDHCVMRSTPKTLETVDVTTAERYIEAASIIGHNSSLFREKGKMPSIAFSGGDPYIQPKPFKHLIKHATRFGLRSEGATSGFWGRNRKRCFSYLEELKDCGLHHVGLSWDDKHAPYVSAGAIRNIIDAVIAFDMKVTINVLQYQGAIITVDNFWEKLGVSAKQANIYDDKPNILQVRENHYCEVGRGKNHDNLIVDTRRDYTQMDRCDFAIASPVMDWNGDFFCCCGFSNYDFHENLDKSPLFLRNLNRLSVQEIVDIYEDMKHDLMFLMMYLIGPSGFLREVEKDNPDLVVRKKYCGQCDICNELWGNGKILERVPATLERLAAEIHATSVWQRDNA